MRSDVVVVGAELDALLAALRLLECGARVRMLATGGGSLPYAPGGLQLLGCGGENPFEVLESLAARHPLRLLGAGSVTPAIDWFLSIMDRLGWHWICGEENSPLLTMTGAPRYVLAHPESQATLDALQGRRIGVAAFDRFRDFPSDLVAVQLRRRGMDAAVFRIATAIGGTDSVRLGQAFDRPSEADALFATIRQALPEDREVVLLPAVLGIHRHSEVLERIERAIGRPVLETATLPPSLFGVRLHHLLMREILRLGGIVQYGMSEMRGRIAGDRCGTILDREGRSYDAAHYVVGAGGVLMGGLQVDSHGHVFEPLFDLVVHQTNPLRQRSPAATIDALHRAGVEASAALRPAARGGAPIENIRVTGTMLAHWNPTREGSAEGVAISTGWAAAEAIAGSSRG
jgi:glycerol-3-phosphate dehydrogenase subunit B